MSQSGETRRSDLVILGLSAMAKTVTFTLSEMGLGSEGWHGFQQAHSYCCIENRLRLEESTREEWGDQPRCCAVIQAKVEVVYHHGSCGRDEEWLILRMTWRIPYAGLGIERKRCWGWLEGVWFDHISLEMKRSRTGDWPSHSQCGGRWWRATLWSDGGKSLTEGRRENWKSWV